MRITPKYSLLKKLWLLLSVALILGLFLFTRSIDIDLHNKRLDLLLNFSRLEVSLDQGVFQVVSFNLVQYDPLVEAGRRLVDALQQLQDPQGIFYQQTIAPVDRAIDSYRAGLEQKLSLLERVKFRAALMRNGLHYLSTAAHQFHHTMDPVADEVVDLLNQFYLYTIFPSDTQHRQLTQGLIHLRQKRFEAEDKQKLMENILFHIEVSLKGMVDLVELQQRYFAIKSQHHFDELRSRYREYHDQTSGRAERFSYLLLFLIVGLLVGLTRLIDKLEETGSKLGRAWSRLHDAVESLPEAFALFDADKRLVLTNHKWVEFYPWLLGQLDAHHSIREFEEESRELVKRIDIKEGASSETGGSESYYERLRDGRWLLASNSRTEEGGVACVRVDITASKEAESELRKLSLATEQSPASIIITNTKGVIEYVNPKFVEVSGYSSAEVIGKNPRILQSGDKTQEDYRQLWGRILRGQEWQGQFHNKRKDGSLYWEWATISPLRDEEGHITHFIAVKEDITARKEAEDQLRLSAAVFETSNEGIMIADLQRGVIAVNPSFTRITGFSPIEALLYQPWDFASRRHDKAFYQRVENSLLERGFWSGEMWGVRKQGSEYPLWMSMALIDREQGEESRCVLVFSDITKRKQDEEQILYQAQYDMLTNLPNRTLLRDRLQQAIATAKQERWLMALLFLDLDFFKTVNDTLGHAAGDRLLKQVAARLQACVRESDTIARFGGDEFVVLLQDIPDVDYAGWLAGSLNQALEQPFTIDNRSIFIGSSIGITLFPEDTESADAMLRYADMAMYRAKEEGRNNFQFFTRSMQEKVNRSVELEHDLRLALESEQLQLFYQPIVDAQSGDLVSAEVLLRWPHPEHGYISPGDFVPLAEESGLITQLGRWVLEQACQQMGEWSRRGQPIHLSVNVSSRQRSETLTAESMDELLKRHGLKGEQLTLEITESMLLDDNSETIAWLEQIKLLGVRLSIDDFGTGYSSLGYLKKFPIDTLKVDQSFVRDLAFNSEDRSLVAAVLAMARSLNLKVVAEGVETSAQQRFLQQLNCHYLQGNLFSTPIPADQFEARFIDANPSSIEG